MKEWAEVPNYPKPGGFNRYEDFEPNLIILAGQQHRPIVLLPFLQMVRVLVLCYDVVLIAIRQ